MSRFPLFLVLIVGFVATEAAWADRPNIVVILADDLGFGDVQALNPRSKIPTPNLNGLARSGMTFGDAHTPSSVCTPTRYGLLTGRYCWRSRLKRGVLNGYSPPLIEQDRETIATFLSKAGYRTGIVGKWHLGLGFVRNGKEIKYSQPLTDGPNQHGFHYSYIIPASLDFPPYVFIENGRVTDPRMVDQPRQGFPGFLRQGPRSRALTMENCLDDLTGKACQFIDRNADSKEPFFLYFPLTAPHKPVLPHPRFRGKSTRGDYGDFVCQVDQTVGKILDTIRSRGIEKSTLLVFTSDNGSYMHRIGEDSTDDHLTDSSVQGFFPRNHESNGPWRGTKADIWEAGHRVPFFVRWPGNAEPGSRCEKTICLTDLFATFADIVDRPLQRECAPDSFSLVPLIEGNDWETPREPVIHHSAAGMFAIRSGEWKLVLGNGSGGRQQPKGKPFAKPFHLSNLSEDPGETKNFRDRFPAIAEKLESQCRDLIERGRSRK